MTETAKSLGTTLRAVMSLEHARGETGTASATRWTVLDGLRDANGPVTTEDLATSLDLHVNTVRGHLDGLVEAGYATSERATPDGRGRPKKLYTAVTGLTMRLEDLGDQLAEALDHAPASDVAREAAKSWHARGESQPAATPDEAVERAVTALREVGFEAESDAFGTQIAMSACPYGSLIKDYPVICAIHAEMVSLVLQDAGQHVTLEGVDVWVRPGQCRVRLTRPDATPEFSIPSDSPQAPDAAPTHEEQE